MTLEQAKADKAAAMRIQRDFRATNEEIAAARARILAANEIIAAHEGPREISEAELDRKMATAGFESAGLGSEIFNRLNPVDGDSF